MAAGSTALVYASLIAIGALLAHVYDVAHYHRHKH